MKGKALRRAMETKDYVRVNGDIPLITDETVLVTPQIAHEMLKNNKKNRPINWKKVEEYADLMSNGGWKLHSQGIILDQKGNILTGQKRLWAVIYSDTAVYMRISRGNPESTANLLDRGTPQTARDLASRKTDRKHSPTEVSIIRGVCILNGITKPNADHLAEYLVKFSNNLSLALGEVRGTNKTKSIILVLSAIMYSISDTVKIVSLCKKIDYLADELDKSLHPDTSKRCFGKGAAYGFALQSAVNCVTKFSKT